MSKAITASEVKVGDIIISERRSMRHTVTSIRTEKVRRFDGGEATLVVLVGLNDPTGGYPCPRAFAYRGDEKVMVL